MIGLADSGGARIQEGVDSLAGYADIFLRNTLASGVVPDHGGARTLRRRRGLQPGDHRLYRDGQKHRAYVHHWPDVIKTVLHEEVTKEDLGGGGHAGTSGVLFRRQ